MPALVAALAGAALATTIGACGGGGASFGGGIGGSGVVFGVIEGSGSIVVDGIEFDTSTAEVTLNGLPADESDLVPGLVVRVEAEIDGEAGTGVAELVESSTVVEGPVSAVDLSQDSATILDNNVVIDANTIFDGIVLAPDAVGRIVEVSGFIDADGTVHATRFAARAIDEGSTVSVGGIVANFDAEARTFTIRELLIDFSDAEIDARADTALADGVTVVVELAAAPVGGFAQAARVHVRPDVGVDLDRVVQLRGFVTALAAPGVFILDKSIGVAVDRRTEIRGGELGDIRRNTAVRVIGRPTDRRTVRAAVVVVLSAVAEPTQPAPR